MLGIERERSQFDPFKVYHMRIHWYLAAIFKRLKITAPKSWLNPMIKGKDKGSPHSPSKSKSFSIVSITKLDQNEELK